MPLGVGVFEDIGDGYGDYIQPMWTHNVDFVDTKAKA